VIPEAEIERAVDWLRESASEAAQARATREYLDEYRKTMRATIMAEHKNLPLAAQEREANSDPRYVAHLEAFKQAVYQDERFRWLRVAAETKISVWQSQMRSTRTGI
jgi:uncharacterized membrane-anchored protein YjiN (DUF445 family)